MTSSSKNSLNGNQAPLLEDDAIDLHKKEQPLNICGIELKKNYTKRNLLAVFYIWFLMSAAGGYFSVQLVYLLRDEGYFGISEEK